MGFLVMLFSVLMFGATVSDAYIESKPDLKYVLEQLKIEESKIDKDYGRYLKLQYLYGCALDNIDISKQIEELKGH